MSTQEVKVGSLVWSRPPNTQRGTRRLALVTEIIHSESGKSAMAFMRAGGETWVDFLSVLERATT